LSYVGGAAGGADGLPEVAPAGEQLYPKWGRSSRFWPDDRIEPGGNYLTQGGAAGIMNANRFQSAWDLSFRLEKLRMRPKTAGGSALDQSCIGAP